MLKKSWFICFIAVAGFFPALAHAGTGFLPNDTLSKDSTLQPLIVSIADPKDDFRKAFMEETDEKEIAVSVERLNPLAAGFVEDYIDKYGKMMEEMKISAKPRFEIMDAVLSQYDLPVELKYLAVIESYLNTNARSRAGAVGAWQFMPTTARNMGLKVGKRIDERKDLFKSTHAASKYLNTLYELYGDWLLVIAAYNGGPGKVNAAIKKSGSTDFWTLQNYLPLESRNHVKKFIATHYIMEGCGGITTLSKKEAEDFLLAPDSVVSADAISQPIAGRYNSAVIAKHLSLDIMLFHQLNPGFDNSIADNGKYNLRLPADKMELFLEKKSELLKESVLLLLNGASASTKL